ncbi:transporter substrate-binding domain-containing protein [Pseudodesulfovibrio sp.]|nr:transporter substrate-binding domain-containing protein [Pseudodesulfovibrio sp.]
MRNYLVLCFLLFFASLALADEVVVPVDHFPPWKIVGNDKSVGGVDIILLNSLLRSMGLKPRYEVYPWVRCLHVMEAGQADLISGVIKSADREEYLYFIAPPYKRTSKKVFYIRKGGDTVVQKFDDLVGLKIGVQFGVKYFDKFDADATLKKMPVKNDYFNMQKLISGRIDTFITTETVGDYYLALYGYSDEIEKAQYYSENQIDVYFAISKKSELMKRVPELSSLISELVFSGFVERMTQSVISNQSEQP